MDPEDEYSRQRLLPGWDQGRLAAATVIVAGVGALGNETAKNLALAGVGRLILCDPDVVSISNLSRTVLLGARDLGAPKAVAAATALSALAPRTEVVPRVGDLVSGVGLGELSDAALAIGCVDTLRARMQLLGRCALVGTALVDGGTHAWGGEVRLRLSVDEPCHGCTLTAHQRGIDDLPWSCFEPRGHDPEPAGIGTTALIGAWMTTAALDVLLGRPPAWRVLDVDAAAGRAGPVDITRDPSCPFHRPLTGQPLPTPIRSSDTVAALLAGLDAADEPRTWAEFPLALQCRVCRQYAETTVHRCENCGALLRPSSSLRLRDADPGNRLSDLGVAPEEILPVERAEGARRCLRLSH